MDADNADTHTHTQVSADGGVGAVCVLTARVKVIGPLGCGRSGSYHAPWRIYRLAAASRLRAEDSVTNTRLQQAATTRLHGNIHTVNVELVPGVMCHQRSFGNEKVCAFHPT